MQVSIVPIIIILPGADHLHPPVIMMIYWLVVALVILLDFLILIVVVVVVSIYLLWMIKILFATLEKSCCP